MEHLETERSTEIKNRQEKSDNQTKGKREKMGGEPSELGAESWDHGCRLEMHPKGGAHRFNSHTRSLTGICKVLKDRDLDPT